MSNTPPAGSLGAEGKANPPLPVFAYGTLRDPEVLRYLGVTIIERRSAVALGRRHTTLTSYPAVSFEAREEEIVGELLWLDPSHFETALRRLDRYERLPQLFERIRLTVKSGDDEYEAYAYGWRHE